jgi:signal transduction histidine kinase
VTDGRSRRAVRALQVGFLALLTICSAQLAYWMADEYRYTADIVAQRRVEYEANARAASELLTAGVSWPQIAAMHPEVERLPDGTTRVSASALARLDADRFHRLNRYSWEGAFFLTVIFGAMAVVYTALRAETELRQRQEQFLAASSHELKSPLASLRLSADTLAMRDPPPEHRAKLVQRVLADLGRLDRTIGNILDASRLSGDAVRVVREPVSLAREVADVTDELRLLAEDEGLKLAVDVPATLTIVADREGVRTIVRNLVHNAIKASRGAADGSTVTVTAAAEAHHVRLDVRDQGMGFDPAETQRLFDKFYRIESTGQERLPGTGLGLYLVRRCIELDGGTVSASSEGNGHGASFTVRWPLPQLHEA